MAQYKVPQDVEADDKLLGPFSFRQFIYLLIAGGAIALAVVLFQIFPLLAIIPSPIILFFIVLALPIRKEQPMETYLAALISFYLKPRKRFWVPGQRESTIKITVPKIVEEPRMRNISGQEAGHRLSFLAELVDTGGQSIKNPQMREDILDEADSIVDMFDTGDAAHLGQQIDQSQMKHHKAVVDQMRTAIQENERENLAKMAAPTISRYPQQTQSTQPVAEARPNLEDIIVQPVFPTKEEVEQKQREELVTQKETQKQEKKEKDGVQFEKIQHTEKPTEKSNTIFAKPGIIDLAHNKDFTVETIQKEANRINKKEEVYISLH